MAISQNVGGMGGGSANGGLKASAATTVAGAITLPATGGNQTLTLIATITIIAGAVAVLSHLALLTYKKISK